MKTLDDFSSGFNYKKVNGKLRKLYKEKLDGCSDCILSEKYPNNKGRLWGKLSDKPVLTVSQNPSYYWYERDKSSTDVGGNLEAIDNSFNNLLSKKLKENNLPHYNNKLTYITNVLKCCTEKNRYPDRELVKNCGDNFLTEEIKIIKPRRILSLGRLSEYYLKNRKIDSIFNVKFFPHPGSVRRRGYTKANEFVDEFIEAIDVF